MTSVQGDYEFQIALCDLLRRYGAESKMGTKDYALARYILECVRRCMAFDYPEFWQDEIVRVEEANQ